MLVVAVAIVVDVLAGNVKVLKVFDMGLSNGEHKWVSRSSWIGMLRLHHSKQPKR